MRHLNPFSAVSSTIELGDPRRRTLAHLAEIDQTMRDAVDCDLQAVL